MNKERRKRIQRIALDLGPVLTDHVESLRRISGELRLVCADENHALGHRSATVESRALNNAVYRLDAILKAAAELRDGLALAGRETPPPSSALTAKRRQ